MYVGINSIWAAIVYYGTFGGINGFANLAMFGAWFLFFVSMLMVTTPGIKALAESDGVTLARPYMKQFDIAFDVVITGIFVFSGFIVTATVYTLHTLLQMSAREQALKLRDQTTNGETK